MGLTNALNNRPVRVLGFLCAAHSLIYGIGSATALGGFPASALYISLGEEFQQAFGICLILVGALLGFAYARNNPKTVRVASLIQSATWLFATSLFLVKGGWLLALGTTLPWALISSYLAFAFNNRIDIMAYDRTPQARLDTLNEDTL